MLLAVLPKVYDVLTWFVTMFVLDYMVGPFVLYDIPRSLKVCTQPSTECALFHAS